MWNANAGKFPCYLEVWYEIDKSFEKKKEKSKKKKEKSKKKKVVRKIDIIICIFIL